MHIFFARIMLCKSTCGLLEKFINECPKRSHKGQFFTKVTTFQKLFEGMPTISGTWYQLFLYYKLSTRVPQRNIVFFLSIGMDSTKMIIWLYWFCMQKRFSVSSVKITLNLIIILKYYCQMSQKCREDSYSYW